MQIGLRGMIRTCGLLTPNQADYQTFLRVEVGMGARPCTESCGFGGRRAPVKHYTHVERAARLERATSRFVIWRSDPLNYARIDGAPGLGLNRRRRITKAVFYH